MTNKASVTIDGAGSSFAKINSLVTNHSSGSFEISGGYDFTATGTFNNSGSVTIGSGSTFTAASGFTQLSTGTLRGSGTLVGNVTNSGAIRPGHSPGIINIDGNLTQTSSSTLEIEVGGLTPGTQHDKVIVTGIATLDGRLDIPMLPGYTPAVNDEITFLTASSVVGDFATIKSIGLKAANPNIAIEVVQSATDMKIVFVAPEMDNNFSATSATADWDSASTWTTGIVPETENTINIDNLAGEEQRVNVQTDDAFVHQLSLVSTTDDPITLGITSGKSLSAIVGATIGDQATVELDSGTVVTSTLIVQAGGELTGNGTVVGTLMLGDESSTTATLSPGFSVGNIDVIGDYQQEANGELVIDVEGILAGQFDTLDVTGQVTLGGTVVIMLDENSSVSAGDVIEVITTDGNVTGKFDSVLTTGVNDIYLAPIYGDSFVALQSLALGDMNQVDGLNADDAVAFALALTDPDEYFDAYFISGSEPGDIDLDGILDFDDIDDFVALLNAELPEGFSMAQMMEIIQAAQPVPEPTGLVLSLAGCFLLCPSRRPRRCMPCHLPR